MNISYWIDWQNYNAPKGMRIDDYLASGIKGYPEDMKVQAHEFFNAMCSSDPLASVMLYRKEYAPQDSSIVTTTVILAQNSILNRNGGIECLNPM